MEEVEALKLDKEMLFWASILLAIYVVVLLVIDNIVISGEPRASRFVAVWA